MKNIETITRLVVLFLVGLIVGYLVWGFAPSAEATNPKIVSITETEFECGEGERTIEGTANYQGASQDHLVVQLDGNTVIHSHSEPTEWSFTENLTPGSHEVVARIFDDPNTNSNSHKTNHSDLDAIDTWEFDISECQEEPEPTPEPTPQPPVRVENPQGPVGAPQCEQVAPPQIPNLIVENAGVGALEVRWIPTGGQNAHIRYGVDINNPEHALLNTPNDGVEVIRDLVSGKHYWFSVSNGDGCGFSQWSDFYDPLVQ